VFVTIAPPSLDFVRVPNWATVSRSTLLVCAQATNYTLKAICLGAPWTFCCSMSDSLRILYLTQAREVFDLPCSRSTRKAKFGVATF
jgi:hypothetical protein